MMIDFQTLTLAFSNWGSRRVADADCCNAPTTIPAANTTATIPHIINLDFMLFLDKFILHA
jgi:hypothetical protein